MPRLSVPLSLALLLVAAPAALAYDMPSQEFMDNPPADSSMTSGSWADLDNGVASRPYVKSLTVVNGSEATTVFSGGVAASSSAQVGDVTTVVSPINLCRRGQAPAQGTCYATPNRVGIVIGYRTAQGVSLDFGKPSVPLRQIVNADTVFDVELGLNTLGRTLRWTWANGDLLDWKVTDLGIDTGTVRIRVKPVLSPEVDWSTTGPNGCTATPIFDCAVLQASGESLGANLVLSLDETLDPALTGAAFATQGALAGFLVPGGAATAPTLDLQMASPHLRADGSPQRGVLQAFLPSRALLDLYGVLPADAATFFTATRRGDPGSQDAASFERRAESDTASDGLFITIRNISFSAPTYRVAGKAKAARVKTSRRGPKITMSIASLAACRKRACTFTLYRTKPGSAARVTALASTRSSATGAISVLVAAAKLPKGSAYVVAVRRHGTLVASARGRAG